MARPKQPQSNALAEAAGNYLEQGGLRGALTAGAFGAGAMGNPVPAFALAVLECTAGAASALDTRDRVERLEQDLAALGAGCTAEETVRKVAESAAGRDLLRDVTEEVLRTECDSKARLYAQVLSRVAEVPALTTIANEYVAVLKELTERELLIALACYEHQEQAELDLMEISCNTCPPPSPLPPSSFFCPAHLEVAQEVNSWAQGGQFDDFPGITEEQQNRDWAESCLTAERYHCNPESIACYCPNIPVSDIETYLSRLQRTGLIVQRPLQRVADGGFRGIEVGPHFQISHYFRKMMAFLKESSLIEGDADTVPAAA